MLIGEHPEILVLILTMGFMFSSRACVLWEGLAVSVIGLVTVCASGLCLTSVYIMDTFKGTHLVHCPVHKKGNYQKGRSLFFL